jgi:hypothetical protein
MGLNAGILDAEDAKVTQRAQKRKPKKSKTKAIDLNSRMKPFYFLSSRLLSSFASFA